MRILYISKYAITPDIGQPTRQFFLSKNLAKEGHDVTLISSVSAGIKKCPKFEGSSRRKDIEGICHILIAGPLIELGFTMKRIYSWLMFELRLFFYLPKLSDKKPDVIIVSSLSLLTFLNGVYMKRKYSAKLVIEVRDIWPLTLIEIGGFSKKNLLIKFLAWVEKFGYENADGIVGTMPLLDQHVAKISNKPFKFKCIPMGFDPDYYEGDNIALLPEIKSLIERLPKDGFFVCYAGTIGRANLVDEIVEAAKILNEYENNNIYIVIIGNGIMKEKLVNESKNISNIIFYPGIEKKYVVPFLKSFDLLINCWKDEPIYRYGVSPNKWIDYMLSGRPILTAYGGHQSLINEANCGFFIPPNNPDLLADKILEISLMNKDELNDLGQNGLKYIIENRTFSALAKDYISFINHV